MKEVFDVIILGAGASGMMCASTIKRKKVAVVDQAKNAAKKLWSQETADVTWEIIVFLQNFITATSTHF